ncbi:MAG: hypothetical protein GWN97_11375, partial [Thermoplasmata archaeon]|nr:hypothetical protein [Thermoplasmata archaeon]
RKLKIWDDAGLQWITIEDEIGGADILNEWVVRSLAIPYADYRKTFANTEFLPGTHKYFIFAMSGEDYNGFDVDYVKVFLDS